MNVNTFDTSAFQQNQVGQRPECPRKAKSKNDCVQRNGDLLGVLPCDAMRQPFYAGDDQASANDDLNLLNGKKT